MKLDQCKNISQKKKKKLEMGKDLHKRPKTMKLLEEIVVTKLLNRRLSDRCLF